jgi:surface protein
MRNNFFTGLGSIEINYPSEFIILVKTDNEGVSASNEILLPIQGTSMVIDWGDGSVSTHTQTLQPTNTIGGANVMHSYPSVGIYQIRISTSITWIRFANGGDRRKLLQIQNWGKAVWSNLSLAFMGCLNLSITTKDTPNLTANPHLVDTFRGLLSLTDIQNISKWDMSKISNAGRMFFDCQSLNPDVSNWDVGKLSSAFQMFAFCRVFDRDLSNWNTETLRDGEAMFDGAWLFNSDISGWNTSKLINIASMFRNTLTFNQPIQNWDVSLISAMQNTFFNSPVFNQDLGNWVLRTNVLMTQMLNVSNSTIGENFQEAYSRTLIGWANNIYSRGGVVTGRSLGANNRRYNSTNYVSGEQFNNAVDARDYLVTTLGWTITGDAAIIT